MSGREGLDGASPDARWDGPSDRLYGPGDFDLVRPGASDQGDEGRRDQRVVVNILTREELIAKRMRLRYQLGRLREWPTEDEILEEIEQINWLLGDE